MENQEALTKRELNDLRREEKEKNRLRKIRMKQIKSWTPWIVFLGVIVGGIYWAAVTAEKSNNSRPGESVSDMGRDHINVGDEHEGYNSNPPTSGPHAAAAPWGVSTEEIKDENAIHNLEHGGIWISYKDIDDASLDALVQIAQRNAQSVVLSPRSANDSPIAVASWGRLMKLDTVDEGKIVEFIRKNKNKSPEPLAR